MSENSATSIMQRETRVRHGNVPESIGGVRVAIGFNHLAGDEFLLRESGLACHYRKGKGITVSVDTPGMAGTLELFLAGSVHSAIAAINGFTPIHASAVELGGVAIAFTGAPGAGKSTTAAALRQRGLPIVADDTLVIDAGRAAPVCLPGHKRLKLWPDALALTGMPALQLVSEDYRKFFATEGGSEIDAPLPLGAIVSLEAGNDPAFEPVRGAQRIAVLDDDHYTARYHAVAHGLDRGGRLRALAGLANSVPVFRFSRPLDPDRFAESIDFLLREVSQVGG